MKLWNCNFMIDKKDQAKLQSIQDNVTHIKNVVDKISRNVDNSSSSSVNNNSDNTNPSPDEILRSDPTLAALMYYRKDAIDDINSSQSLHPWKIRNTIIAKADINGNQSPNSYRSWLKPSDITAYAQECNKLEKIKEDKVDLTKQNKTLIEESEELKSKLTSKESEFYKELNKQKETATNTEEKLRSEIKKLKNNDKILDYLPVLNEVIDNDKIYLFEGIAIIFDNYAVYRGGLTDGIETRTQLLQLISISLISIFKIMYNESTDIINMTKDGRINKINSIIDQINGHFAGDVYILKLIHADDSKEGAKAYNEDYMTESPKNLKWKRTELKSLPIVSGNEGDVIVCKAINAKSSD